MTRLWISLTLLLLPLSANAQESLKWKFAKGEVFFIERVSHQKTAVDTVQKIHHQESDITWILRIEALADNKLEATTESVVHKVKGAGTAVENKLAERMKGTKFTLKLDASGKIEDWAGHEEFVEKVGGKDDQLKKAIQALYPQEGMKELFAEMFSFLPDQPVKAGDKWERKTRDALPPFGFLALTIAYSLQEAKDAKTLIEGAIQSKYLRPEKQDELFKVVDGNFQTDEAKLTYQFDAEQGRLVSLEKTMRLRGNVTLEIQGMRLPHGIRSENSLKVRFYTK